MYIWVGEKSKEQGVPSDCYITGPSKVTCVTWNRKRVKNLLLYVCSTIKIITENSKFAEQ